MCWHSPSLQYCSGTAQVLLRCCSDSLKTKDCATFHPPLSTRHLYLLNKLGVNTRPDRCAQRLFPLADFSTGAPVRSSPWILRRYRPFSLLLFSHSKRYIQGVKRHSTFRSTLSNSTSLPLVEVDDELITKVVGRCLKLIVCTFCGHCYFSPICTDQDDDETEIRTLIHADRR